MKLRKLISIVAAAAVVVTNAAIISLPTAFAATDEETRTFTENFEGMVLTDTANPESQKATIDALIADGWYPVDNNKAYTSVDTSAGSSHFATVMGDDSNHYLRLNTPSSAPNGIDRWKIGLGRLFPGQGANAKGVWEIDFRFKPYATGSTKAQFNFGMNTYGADVNETIAQHNIISAYNNKMYLGYRDYMPLYQGAGVPQGRIDGAGLAVDWYDVKVIVNCDARYYSVELSRDGSLVARRSAISFAGDETIGFFKMSALGMGSAAAVYVDDITIKPAEKETLIYNEDFETLQNADPVSDGLTTGGETEDVSGHSYFEGFTPWRAHSDIGNSYNIEIDPDLTSQVVRLGVDGKGSGLVYMPAFEKLVDATTQTVRGDVELSFKIKPEDIASSVKVNAIGDHTQDITADSSIAFEIADDGGIPAVMNDGNGVAPLDPSVWYNVDLVFDVKEGTAATTLTTVDGGEEIASFVKNVDTINDEKALKGIMFNVPAGSSVLADDIVLEYCEAEHAEEPAPVIGKIAAMDHFGNQVTDIDNVTAALWAIRIPFGCTLDPNTANINTIKVVDENGKEIAYRGSTSAANSYTLYFNEALLARGTQYQVIVPAAVANISGDELGSEFRFKFTTTEDMPDVMSIDSVKADDKDVLSVSDITAGSKVNVIVNSNITSGYINGTAVMVFRSGGKVVKLFMSEQSIGDVGTGEEVKSFTFEVPSDLDMSKIDDVSVFLWDGFANMTAYCPKVSFSE